MIRLKKLLVIILMMSSATTHAFSSPSESYSYLLSDSLGYTVFHYSESTDFSRYQKRIRRSCPLTSIYSTVLNSHSFIIIKDHLTRDTLMSSPSPELVSLEVLPSKKHFLGVSADSTYFLSVFKLNGDVFFKPKNDESDVIISYLKSAERKEIMDQELVELGFQKKNVLEVCIDEVLSEKELEDLRLSKPRLRIGNIRYKCVQHKNFVPHYSMELVSAPKT